MNRRGHFVWHDLMTSEIDKVAPFYGKLCGWEIQHQGQWVLIVNNGKDQGTVMTTPAGAPAGWIGYVLVDDVAAAGQRAERQGGRMCTPPRDIPNIGRFSVLADREGATITAFSYAGSRPEKAGDPPVGAFCWNEIMTRDPQGAAAFYSEVFGWSPVAMDMGEFGTYTVFEADGQRVAGAMAMPKEVPAAAPAHWLHYIHHANVDAGCEEAQRLGGQVLHPPMSIPGVGRFASLRDPAGAVFALFTP